MNNKGFGIMSILAFAIFAIIAIFLFYSFVTEVVGFIPESHIPNYTNEYNKYFKSAISNNTTTMSNNNNSSVEYSSYSDIESSVNKATKNYVIDFYSEIDVNDLLYIRISTLQTYGYIGIIKAINNDNTICTGYTKIVKNSNNVISEAYINCGDSYITTNYISELDN